MILGPTFGNECISYGLGGLPFTWGEDGKISGRKNLTNTQNTILDQVILNHDPTKQLPYDILVSTIVKRMTNSGSIKKLHTLLLNDVVKFAWFYTLNNVKNNDQDMINLIMLSGDDPNIILTKESI